MAGKGCCYIVGNFNTITGMKFPSGCFISVNNNINTDYTVIDCGDGGPTIGTLNLSGYAGTAVFRGCPGRAGVQVRWTRKYDCENDYVHFIFSGAGRSFLAGPDASSYATLTKVFNKETEMISASSQSGPTNLFTYMTQIEGVGMEYANGPINFNTSTEAGCTLPNMGIGQGDYYLQSFNIELVPGSIPVANYTFAYNA